MNRAFSARGFFTVPDGTDVSPFLNATDVMQDDVPWARWARWALPRAAFLPDPLMDSRPPVVVQVTYVVSGQLNIRMKEFETADPHDLRAIAGQRSSLRPGTLFQLRNDADAPAEVLYIVSPPTSSR